MRRLVIGRDTADDALAQHRREGIDVYSDNDGRDTLEAILECIDQKAGLRSAG